MIYNVMEKYYHTIITAQYAQRRCPNGVPAASIKMQKTKVRE